MPARGWRLHAMPFTLRLRRTFRIAAGGEDAARVVLVRVTGPDGVVGWGEADPSLRVTGESEAGVLAFLRVAAERVALLPRGAAEDDDLGRALRPVESFLGRVEGNGSAKAAVVNALLDAFGKARRRPVHDMLGLAAASLPTSATVSLGPPEEMAEEAAAHADEGFRVLKVKLGDGEARDERRLRAVRDAVPASVLRVDANEGWTREEALRAARWLDRLEVELVEQPVSRHEPEAMGAVADALEAPVVADEPIHTRHDAARYLDGGWCDGVNVKQAKCGGLLEAARIASAARHAEKGLFLGCMIETSCAISAAAQLLGAARWADLDGAWLTKNDPFRGAALADGAVATPLGAGVGAVPGRGFRFRAARTR